MKLSVSNRNSILFRRGMSQSQVARALGVTQQAVHQVEQRALRKCRQRMLERLQGLSEQDEPRVGQLRRLLKVALLLIGLPLMAQRVPLVNDQGQFVWPTNWTSAPLTLNGAGLSNVVAVAVSGTLTNDTAGRAATATVADYVQGYLTNKVAGAVTADYVNGVLTNDIAGRALLATVANYVTGTLTNNVWGAYNLLSLTNLPPPLQWMTNQVVVAVETNGSGNVTGIVTTNLIYLGIP